MNPPNWDCMQCGKSTKNDIDYYMLTDKTWLQAAPSKRGKLCLDCVQKKLGRSIVKEDVIDCPLNRSHPLFKAFF
jgi:hypothetical protein